MGERVDDEITIDAPLRDVAAVILDVGAYPSWIDGVRSARVLDTYDDGSPRNVRLRIDAKIMEVECTIEYRYEGDDVLWHLVDGDVLSQLDAHYQLVAQGPEHTWVGFHLDVDVSVPLPGYLKKRASRGILEHGLSGLKRRVEEGTA